MDTQTLINTAFALIGALGGWILNNIKTSVDELRKADLNLADKVQHIELLVAGTYVKRDDMEKMSQALFLKLDKIEAKLDAKVDRKDCIAGGRCN
jgi:hypothetical protein